MSARNADARAAVADGFARLWRALEAVPDLEDRRVIVDEVRAALDRGTNDLFDGADILAGSYGIERTLHEGPATLVFAARHRDLGHARAIKTLRPERAHDPLARRMLLCEAEIHLGLRSEGVLRAETLLRLGDGRPALVLDLIEGGSLADRLARRGLDASEAVFLARRLARTLACVHEAGVAHLDLTPANILLPEGEVSRALICDFGLSRRLGERADPDVAFAGSPGFAAPETDAGTPAAAGADLFALGAILKVATCADEPLERLIEALLEIDPDRRPRDAAAVEAALAFAEASEGAGRHLRLLGNTGRSIRRAGPEASSK